MQRAGVRALLPCALLALAGCVTYPVFVAPVDPACKLISREMTLETRDLLAGGRGPCSSLALDSCVAEILVGMATFTVTTVVSGSVVIVGNTVHGLETSARCPLNPPSAAPAPGQPRPTAAPAA